MAESWSTPAIITANPSQPREGFYHPHIVAETKAPSLRILAKATQSASGWTVRAHCSQEAAQPCLRVPHRDPQPFHTRSPSSASGPCEVCSRRHPFSAGHGCWLTHQCLPVPDSGGSRKVLPECVSKQQGGDGVRAPTDRAGSEPGCPVSKTTLRFYVWVNSRMAELLAENGQSGEMRMAWS